MKKIITTSLLLSSLLFNTACTPEEAAVAVGVGAGLIFVANLDNNDYKYQNGQYYYRTPSCNRNYEYYDSYGRNYYPNDCVKSNGKYYVTFGIALLIGLAIYK